jgi:hypothetical protein
LALDESLQLADQSIHRTSHWKYRPPYGHGDHYDARADGDFVLGHTANQPPDFLPDSIERHIPGDDGQ